MSKHKHTPGPWQISVTSDDGDYIFYGVEADGVAIADVYRGEKHEANARLIAAAPEMYEAMRRFRNAFVGWIEARDSWDDEEIADAEDFLDDTRKDLIDLFERIEGETK